MTEWGFADAVWLVARAYGWLVGVTMPVVMLAVVTWTTTISALTFGWSGAFTDVVSVLPMVVLVDLVAGVVAVGGALVSLPFTHAVGRLLRHTSSWGWQVLATTALAGVLGAATAWVAGESWAPHSGPAFAVFIGTSAAGAGALARWGQLLARRRARITTVGTLPFPIGAAS